MRKGSARLAIAGALAAAVLSIGCEGREATRQAADSAEVPSVQTDPVAERGFIRLTGCVKPDATPGRYVLASVGTAGVLDSPPENEDARSWTAEDGTTETGDVTTRAASTYQLIPGDEDLAAYADQRVIVRGRLAAEVPTGTSGETGTGTEVERDNGGATVRADAPPLRGFHVESVDKVANTCE